MSPTKNLLATKTGFIWPKKLKVTTLLSVTFSKQPFRYKSDIRINLHRLQQLKHSTYLLGKLCWYSSHTNQFNYLIVRNHLLNNLWGTHVRRKNRLHLLPHFQGSRYLQLL